jgi:hypothetical protein
MPPRNPESSLGKATPQVDAYLKHIREHGSSGANPYEVIRHLREHSDESWNKESNTYATPRSKFLDGD